MNNNSQSNVTKHTTPAEFYPRYLSEHQNTVNRALHFVGIGLMGLCFVTAMLFHLFIFFALMVIIPSVLDWIGHQFFEKNKPSTFKHPILSLACDFILFGDLMMGRQSFKTK